MALNKTFHFFIFAFLLTSCNLSNEEKEVPRLEVRNPNHSLKISICEGAGTRNCGNSGTTIIVQDYEVKSEGLNYNPNSDLNENIILNKDQESVFDDLINLILNDDFDMDDLSYDAPTGCASIKILIDNELVYYKTVFSSNSSSEKINNLVCFFANLYEYECDDFYIIEKQW